MPGVIAVGTGGDGTGLEETGGHASSQQLIPPTGPHHHFLFLMYSKKTRKRAPNPATAPKSVPPLSVPGKRFPTYISLQNYFLKQLLCQQ